MMKNLRNIAVWTTTGLLAAACVALGMLTLTGDDSFLWSLCAYPQSARVPVALIAMAAGLLLLAPRLTWMGCIVLSGLVIGTLYCGESWQAFAPASLLFPLGTLGYIRLPSTIMQERVRSAADAFATRELARHTFQQSIRPHQELTSRRALAHAARR
jgi:hypothetical protein